MPVLGFWDLLIIGFIALLVFGPKRLPKLGRSLGTGIRELGKAGKELRDEVTAKHDRELETPPKRPRPTPSGTSRERDSIS